MKRKTQEQKRMMENELKRTITKTVDEMSNKIGQAKGEMYTERLLLTVY
jgi:hypothetical protein